VRVAATGKICLTGVEFRQPEVEHFDRSVSGDLDVARLQIAVDDSLVVRGLERRRDLSRQAQRFVERQPRGRTRALGEHLGKRLAFDQFHHQIIRSDVVQRADVWMIERGDRARFALEALAETLVGELDGDVASEPGIAGSIHDAHAASPDLGRDLIRANSRADVHFHDAT
jgi:hypothetical protein